MDLTNQGPPPTKAKTAIAWGVTAAAVLYVIAVLFGKSYGYAFFSIPYFMGLVAGGLVPRRPYVTALATLAVALLLTIVTLSEGVVCVLMALPLILPLALIGAFSGQILRRHIVSRSARHTSLSVIVLIGAGWQFMEAHFDDPATHPLHVARSESTVPAAPVRVFRTLTQDAIDLPHRWPWFLTIGLPVPKSLRVEIPGPAGRLRIEFNHGTAFGHVTTWRPPNELAFTLDQYAIRDLPFHITRLGRGPHYGLRTERVEDWLTFTEIRYIAERTADGATRLIRVTSWRRHLAPGFYFGWLQQTILERGQARLLELVGERATREEPNLLSDTGAPPSP